MKDLVKRYGMMLTSYMVIASLIWIFLLVVLPYFTMVD
jgi:hypothetical protein